MSVASKDNLPFVNIPKNTCFLSGISRKHILKESIWLSYYGTTNNNISIDSINNAIKFSNRYSTECGIAFFTNKETLRLLYIPYISMNEENNQNVLNKAVNTLIILINYVISKKLIIKIKNKTISVRELIIALIETLYSRNTSENLRIQFSIDGKNHNINAKTITNHEFTKGNPDYLAAAVIKQYGIENNFDGWIRKSKMSTISQGDEIYLFSKDKLSLDCGKSTKCSRGSIEIRNFCDSSCYYPNRDTKRNN